MKNKMKKLIVVGAGFWGCTIAERIASADRSIETAAGLHPGMGRGI